jgi:hypothetical protein
MLSTSLVRCFPIFSAVVPTGDDVSSKSQSVPFLCLLGVLQPQIISCDSRKSPYNFAIHCDSVTSQNSISKCDPAVLFSGLSDNCNNPYSLLV